VVCVVAGFKKEAIILWVGWIAEQHKSCERKLTFGRQLEASSSVKLEWSIGQYVKE
jgi:hypothetical protein